MRTQLTKLALTAGIVLAISLTLSCSSDKDDGGNSGGSSSEYTGGSCNASDYGTVEIGSQVWMAKNWGCYASGSKCYGNQETNCDKYGRLYNWETAMNACPSGWHLPSDDEWHELINFVEYDKECSYCAGKYLKASSGWNDGGNGTNEYGFTALPGGVFVGSDGGFGQVGRQSYWWSASEYDADYAYNQSINVSERAEESGVSPKGDLLISVRCLQD